ncbi:High-affinity glucose transporter [Colletotrichum fructicola]|uniref:High-affinity glucose transporter n=2 Tax=Colletotrichum fructicola (strain Nara gc5) TaxID=1213859 RepID=A0A7J6J645_COLFN|nr:High-affinity glucose transporter [Colletotrichum fructicola Nara gc5]KAF4900184.1 High-affinity glucose transporter [Colletotrichum fructicola]KAF4932945.1 High-affinity glucose transporter [Colletotrichum fructicola]
MARDTSPWLSKPFLTSILLGIGGFLYGYDSGIITPSLALKSFLTYFGNPDAPLRGAIVASVGITSDRLGRRRAIAFGCIWGVIGGALMAGAVHVAMLIMGRLLVGYAVGTITGVAPVFGAEIAKTEERARVTAVNQMMVAWGFFVALWTGVGEGKWHNSNQWRLGFAIQSIPALILGVGVLFLSESPRWLCLKGRNEEAEKAFRNYHYNGSNDNWCRTEFTVIQVNIAEELQTQGRLSWADLFKTPAFRKRLFVGSFVWAAAMLSGISFVQYYQTAIYATLQFSQDQQLLVSGLYGSVAPVACFLSLFFVDRIGRKKILIFSSSLLSVCYMIITILAAVYPARPGFPTNEAAQRGLIACIFAVSANYSALLGPMTWIIPPEVFTTELRAKANAIVQVIHYSISLVITQCSPIALAEVGWKYYILFILTNAICAVVFALFYPETRGKSLEEIDEIFGDVNIVRELDADLAEKAGAEEVEVRRSMAT